MHINPSFTLDCVMLLLREGGDNRVIKDTHRYLATYYNLPCPSIHVLCKTEVGMYFWESSFEERLLFGNGGSMTDFY